MNNSFVIVLNYTYKLILMQIDLLFWSVTYTILINIYKSNNNYKETITVPLKSMEDLSIVQQEIALQ